MYQELELFEESFDGCPVWSTEGSDLPLPLIAVGNLFEHDGLPNICWRMPPEPTQVFKVIAIKHVFRETGRGAKTTHLLKVAVALGGLESRQEVELYQAETALENQTRRGDFLDFLLYELASHDAAEVWEKLILDTVSAMKTTPARGIHGEAEFAWEEAALIFQTSDHLQIDILQPYFRADVQRAIAKMNRIDRLILWLESAVLENWFPDDFPNAKTGFDPLKHSPKTLETVESQLMEHIVSLLHAHDIQD